MTTGDGFPDDLTLPQLLARVSKLSGIEHVDFYTALTAAVTAGGGGGGGGTGDVVGPAASADGEVALYSGVTGKLLKRATGTGVTRITGGVQSVSELSGDVTTAGTLAVTIANDAVTYAKMQNVSAASQLLGRGDSGAGDVEEITLGTNLTLTGTTLSASGGDVVGPAASIDGEAALYSGTTGKALKRATGTGLARLAAGIQSAEELTGAVSTSGSNLVTLTDNAVTYAKLQDMPASRVLGRGASGSGDPQELTLGTNLTITGTTLNAPDRGFVSSGTFVGNVGGGEDDLKSWNMPANTIIVDSGVHVKSHFSFAGNANTKTLKFHIGGSSFTLNNSTAAPAVGGVVDMTIWWNSVTSVFVTGIFAFQSGMEQILLAFLNTGITLTNATILKFTGTGIATDDVRQGGLAMLPFRNPT